MSSARLLDYFLSKGKITQQQADEIRVEVVKNNQSEEALLALKELATQLDIAKAKSEIFNIPFVDLKEIKIEESVMSLVGIDLLKKFRAVPYEKAGHIIKVAMADPFDIQTIQALESKLSGQGRILVFIATDEAVNEVLERNIGDLISSEVSEALDDVEDDGEVQEISDADADSLDSTLLQSAPVARIVNSIFQYAIKTGASDIHIEPQEGRVRVRFRIHGVMVEKLVLPYNLRQSIAARIKILSDLKIDEKRVPQDGRIQIKSMGHRVDVRVSTMPSIYGEKIVMRLLDTSEGVPSLESTGMRGNAWDTYVKAMEATNGIILITGPTGSGKTRTLAGTLGQLNDPTVNIITLEDPVEIRIPGITQVQINADVGLTFASGLRSILRQDPDVVMVGEIRDEETAALAVEASLTGHIVLATLHTNSAAASIPRLLDMGIENYLLTSTMKIAAAQRLPRTLCKECRKFEEISDEVVKDIEAQFSGVAQLNLEEYMMQLVEAAKSNTNIVIKAPEKNPDGSTKFFMARPVGCDVCAGTGYRGRVGIFEVMKVTNEIIEMILQKRPASDIEAVAVSQGMLKMIHDGYLKALEGVTTIEEVLRVCKE